MKLKRTGIQIERQVHDNGEHGETVDQIHVELESDKTNNIHEAYLVLNSIAVANRKSFREQVKPGSEIANSGLAAATLEFLNLQIDVLYAHIQKSAREKTRDGLLTDAIILNAGEDSLAYVYGALAYYVECTPEAVNNEMHSTMGDQAALARTFEAVTAEHMLSVMRELPIEVINDTIPDRPPVGFGRVLMNPDPQSR